MKSIFQRFRDGLRKSTPTFHKLFGQVEGIFGKGKLPADSIEELEEALYGADFGVETATEILSKISAAVKKDRSLKGQEAAHIGASVLRRVLEGAQPKRPWLRGTPPEAIVLLGVNGAGKTTTTAKLAWHLQQEGHSVLMGACDTFRAAANEQIMRWSEALEIELVASQHGGDAAAVAFDAWQAAKARKHDVVLLDTAGRLHTKTNLLKELEKLRRVLAKQDPEAPHHRWLVIDGSLGSNSIEQARTFHETFGLTGLIITKLDGTSRGGALVGIYRELRLPIYFVGLGEAKEDLQPFNIDAYANSIFGIEPAVATADNIS